MTNNQIILLMAMLVVKHFFADFPLMQTGWMAMGKGKPGVQFVLPLSAHAGVHAAFTAVIFYFFTGAWYLGLVDFVAHFIIDRIKSTYRLPIGQWTPEEKKQNIERFYLAFGMDQLAHYMTYILIMYLALN